MECGTGWARCGAALAVAVGSSLAVLVSADGWTALLALTPALVLAVLLLLRRYPAEETLTSRLRARRPRCRARPAGGPSSPPRRSTRSRRTGLRFAYPLAMRPPPVGIARAL